MCSAKTPKIEPPPPPPPAPVETVATLEAPKKKKAQRQSSDRSALIIKGDPKALNAPSSGSGLTLG